MTYSNGTYNPHPLANPFNTRLGPANYSLNPYGENYNPCGFTSSNKTLPKPIMLGEVPEWKKNLKVPQSEKPMSLAEIQGILNSYSSSKTWNNQEIYSLNSQDNTIDKKSQDYWKHANAENEKMLSSMSDEQKKMLADLDKMFPKSKLEEVDEF